MKRSTFSFSRIFDFPYTTNFSFEALSLAVKNIILKILIQIGPGDQVMRLPMNIVRFYICLDEIHIYIYLPIGNSQRAYSTVLYSHDLWMCNKLITFTVNVTEHYCLVKTIPK